MTTEAKGTTIHRRLILPALALALGALTACNNGTNEGSKGSTANIPGNQGIGGANDGAPGGTEAAATAHPGSDDTGNPAGAQNYPATGKP